jgi:gliding motility-associated-like protein
LCGSAFDSTYVSFIDCNLWAPLVFSPNTDGVNDIFFVKGIELDDVSISFFNRWGTEVYRDGHYQNDWDGTNEKGINLKEGTYFYILQSNISGNRILNGYVQLIR